MKSHILTFILGLLLFSCQQQEVSVLVEAESFSEKGGWVVDPQFVEQMGSPYLLAHGMGAPVNNAETRVMFPRQGTYHAWVRTKDWAPGDWEAPGRFRLLVNDGEVGHQLGTEPGWGWQYAGEVNITERETTIGLKDLTGFAGRCDAIWFYTSKTPPPSEKDSLRKWRYQQRHQSEGVMDTAHFDLVVVGGGIAGCAASIAAAEKGLKVALIHDRPVLGGNASSEIRVHTLGITWKYSRILDMLNTRHYPNGSPEAVVDEKKRHENMARYNKISLFLNWRAFHAEAKDDSILWVDAREVTSNTTKRFKAPLFMDCTGDGWIGYWAGAEYMYGREPSEDFGESLKEFPDNFSSDFSNEFLQSNWDQYHHLWSPDSADHRVMGSSVLWRTTRGEAPSTFPEVSWALDVAKNHAAVHGEWYWEFSRNDLHQVEDAEEIRDHMFKAIYGSFYNAKQDSGYDNFRLEWVSYLLGKRESRRLVGDYIYSFNDVREQKSFPDSIAKEYRAVDVHYQRELIDEKQPGFLSDALYYRTTGYYIPYRSLYSKNIKNLFMAGRCFSCTHIGLGGPRVMNTTGQMGAAAGYAASIAVKNHVSPRAIYEEYLDELLTLIENSSEPRSEE